MIIPEWGFVNTQLKIIDENFIPDRISAICKAKNVKVKELATLVQLPYSTLHNYASGRSEPKLDFFVALYNFGINFDWLLSGEGSMFRNGEGLPAPEQKQKSLLLCQWIEHYAATRTKSELSWLEVEIARQYPEFNAWLIEQGHEPLAKTDWFDRFLLSPMFKKLSPAERSKIAELVEAAEHKRQEDA